MNALRCAARVLTAAVFLVLVAACATHEAIREARLKRRLGAAYEGPQHD